MSENFDDELADLESMLTRKDKVVDINTAVRKPSRTFRGDVPSSDNIDELQTQMHSQMWAVYGGNKFSPCEHSVKTLPSGQYTIETSNAIGLYFNKVDINLDDLIHLPDSVSEKVITEIESFWEKEQHFRKFGFMWKRGVLLYGPPGSGKTSTLQVISKNVIDAGGISVYVGNPDIAARGLRLLRTIEPKRPLVIMLEDVDAIIDTFGESDLLAMMDGELQIDNVVFVATTNYLDRLDKRFVCRPSRFDSIYKIGMPNDKAREVYLSAKSANLHHNQKELSTWVKETEGFSIAHMKELIISVEVFEVPFGVAIRRLRAMLDKPSLTNDGDIRSNFGFTGG